MQLFFHEEIEVPAAPQGFQTIKSHEKGNRGKDAYYFIINCS